MSSIVQISAADARVLRGLLKGLGFSALLAAFEQQARPVPNGTALPLTLYLAIRDTLDDIHAQKLDRQLQRDGMFPRDIPALLARLGLPVTHRTLDPAGHSVWSLHTEDGRLHFHFLYTPAGSRDDAWQAFRAAFFLHFSDEAWAGWQRRMRVQPGRFAHPGLDPYNPELRHSAVY